MKEFKLIPFVDCSLGNAIDFQVFVDRNFDRNLVVKFVVTGAIDRLEIPPISDSSQRITGLWETTCFEFFFGVLGQENYWEINLSPSGNWNVFRLDGYRRNLREEFAIESLPFWFRPCGDRLLLDITFDLQRLELLKDSIELSVTSVLQETTGDISYWAVTHAGAEADFHLRESFVISGL